MSKKIVTLHAKRVTYFSPGDENAFFHWLALLKDVSRVSGHGDTLEIAVASVAIDDDQLRELIALFHRYRIDMRQLSVFENPQNQSWLRNKRAYWYDAMYEAVPLAG